MHCKSYIEKILTIHGWQETSKNETRMVDPLNPSALKELETTQGPSDAGEAKALEAEMGFGYRAAFA